MSFTYPSGVRPIFTGLDLTIDPGQSAALLGPSGVGKSTLLGVAGGLLKPASGSVALGGRPIDPRGVGWVLQSTNLLPRRSVLDNTVLPAIIRGHSRFAAEKEARERLAAVGLAGFEARHARQLSGGQAQRVGVARAFMTSPALVLADEPTANLDTATAQVVTQNLLDSAGDDVVLIIATHDLAVAEKCDIVLPWEEISQCA